MTRNEDNRNHAIAHTKEMNERFKDNIKSSIENSIIYGGSGKTPRKNISTVKHSMVLLNIDSTEAVLSHPGATMLNFASYKHPGGGFIKGTWAQEEAICHDSNLYNILSHFNSFYVENEKSMNSSLYTDRAIFTPNVIFERNNKTVECNVITCAAPNWNIAINYDVTPQENEEALKQRIDFVISIAEENNCDTIILGAWGCGVFGQNPKVVAKLFKERLTISSIRLAIFAIPGHNTNYESFYEIFV